MLYKSGVFAKDQGARDDEGRHEGQQAAAERFRSAAFAWRYGGSCG
jgi:hypothetical protein